jgi:hypothetical protein
MPDAYVRRYRTRLRPNTASGDSITVQLIQLTDSPSVIMIVWPTVVSKFLDLGGRSKLQLFGGGPQYTAGAQKLTPKLHRAPLPSLDSSLIPWLAPCGQHCGVAVKPSTYTGQNIGSSQPPQPQRDHDRLACEGDARTP